jgi:two-component system, chemotaxis family, CheB/CheR fusion protein
LTAEPATLQIAAYFTLIPMLVTSVQKTLVGSNQNMAKRIKSETAKTKVPTKTSHAKPTQRKAADDNFPIVGIGASAGGLEALEHFLGVMPADSGMALVVIQHLDPTRKAIMSELLQRTTSMKVTQAGNQMKIQPNCVYIIPPNKDMSILHGSLHLLDPVEPRGQRQPIDFFFRALADDRRESAIGVILSGMGSDGTLGLKAIKEAGGLVLVQDPASARFDGMPRSAIDTGMADIVTTTEAMPARLMAACRLPALRHPPELKPESPSHGALEKIVILLRNHTGNDFSLYKKSTMYRRVERRMGIHQIERITTYVRFLQENPGELDLLFKELLIGVTNFFRDPPAWAHLGEHVLPELLVRYPKGRKLRAWVPACSTGEEAYSLAILFREVMDRIKPKARFNLQVFATDLDQDAIDKARQGFYPANISADVSAERLERYFVEEENGYRVASEIREMVIFAPQNLLMDPPFTKLDILSCRNLLIYLAPELQEKLLPLFHYSLSPGGILFLGGAETIGSYNHLFTALDGKSRLYQRTDASLDTAVEFPTRLFPAVAGEEQTEPTLRVLPNLQALTEQMILSQFAPAAVLVNHKGDIVYISGRTGKYLEPAAGKANWNIHAMAREGLRGELAHALQKVLRQRGTVSVEGLRVQGDADQQDLKLTVQAIEEPEALRDMVLIVFHDMPSPEPEKSDRARPASRSGRPTALEQELRNAREENRTLREEMQTTQEELRSANEELQSNNEELQSTNEELTTSKEEMQSLNEELQTVNAELQSKVDDLSHTNNDMRNLLDSTDIATVFLDGQLRVRRFTASTARLIKLIPGDIGRPLSDIVTDLDYPDLHSDAAEVLHTLVFSVKEISTRDGRWYNVRIMPYRTLDNVIDGVVITFVDITATKKLEAELRRGMQA